MEAFDDIGGVHDATDLLLLKTLKPSFEGFNYSFLKMFNLPVSPNSPDILNLYSGTLIYYFGILICYPFYKK